MKPKHRKVYNLSCITQMLDLVQADLKDSRQEFKGDVKTYLDKADKDLKRAFGHLATAVLLACEKEKLTVTNR